MPSRTRVYDRIPRTAYDAHDMLNREGRESLTLGYETTLRRIGTTRIVLRHHHTDIITYHADGSVGVAFDGYYTRTTIGRIRRVLPWGWALEPRRSFGRPRAPEFVFRGAWRCQYGSPWVFYSDGSVDTGGFVLSWAELNRVADQELATMHEDIAHERARTRTRRVRQQEREGRTAAPRRSTPSPRTPLVTNPLRLPWDHPGPARGPDCYTSSSVGLRWTCGCAYTTSCPECGHPEHYTPAACSDDWCVCSATCMCGGSTLGANPTHGRYACWSEPTAEEAAAQFQMSHSWLSPAIRAYVERIRGMVLTDVEVAP